MIDAAILDAMIAAGASAEVVAAAVKADNDKEISRLISKRMKDAERKREQRARENASAMSRGHGVTDADSSGQGVTKESSPTPPKENTSSLRSEYSLARAREIDASFKTDFWPRYPHKVGKPAALRAWRGARKKSTTAEIIAGLERYIAAKPPDRSWCNPATFLNDERFADEPGTSETQNAPRNGNRPRPHDTIIAGMAAFIRESNADGRTDGVPTTVDRAGAGGDGADAFGRAIGFEASPGRANDGSSRKAVDGIPKPGRERGDDEIPLGKLRDSAQGFSGMGDRTGQRGVAQAPVLRGERELRFRSEPAATVTALPDRSSGSASARGGAAEHLEGSSGCDRGGNPIRSLAAG